MREDIRLKKLMGNYILEKEKVGHGKKLHLEFVLLPRMEKMYIM